MELSGLPLGQASEGSFGPDPIAGLFPWNVEVLLFIDDERGIEVVGMAQQATRFAHLLTDDWEAAAQFSRPAGFPEHHLVLRPQGEDDPRIDTRNREPGHSCARFPAGTGTGREYAGVSGK